RSLLQHVPQLPHISPRTDKLRAQRISRRSTNQQARQGTNFHVQHSQRGQRIQIRACQLGNNSRRRWPFQRESPVQRRVVRERHTVHDDEFIERFAQPLANHVVGDAKQYLPHRVSLNLRKDVPLRIQQQRNDALRRLQVLDVVGKDCVQVPHSIGSVE